MFFVWYNKKVNLELLSFLLNCKYKTYHKIDSNRNYPVLKPQQKNNKKNSINFLLISKRTLKSFKDNHYNHYNKLQFIIVWQKNIKYFLSTTIFFLIQYVQHIQNTKEKKKIISFQYG